MRKKYGCTPSDVLRSAVMLLIEERGVEGAADAIGLGLLPTSRIALGQNVREATLAVAELNLPAKYRKAARAA